jgi:hypothetical protein
VISALRQGETVGYAVLRTTMDYGVSAQTLCEFLAKDDEEAVYRRLGKAILAKAQREKASHIASYSCLLPGCTRTQKTLGFANTLHTRLLGNAGVGPALYTFGEGDRVLLKNSRTYFSPGDADFA